MNIFYLSDNTKECAQWHNDRHVVKMILEYAQLLSTAHHVLDGPEAAEKMYRKTHVNHPSAIWARSSKANYQWLYNLFMSTCREYTYRYGKTHVTQQKMETILAKTPANIPDIEFTEPTPAMPDECKIPGNSIESYRKYYVKNKTHLAKWSKRNIPAWYIVGTWNETKSES